jgi:hypothetical protein
MTFGPRLTSFALPGLLVAGCIALSASLVPYVLDDRARLQLPGSLDAIVAGDNGTPEALPSLDRTLSKKRLAALQGFNATVQRPLFSRSRRPFEPEKTVSRAFFIPAMPVWPYS